MFHFHVHTRPPMPTLIDFALFYPSFSLCFTFNSRNVIYLYKKFPFFGLWLLNSEFLIPLRKLVGFFFIESNYLLMKKNRSQMDFDFDFEIQFDSLEMIYTLSIFFLVFFSRFWFWFPILRFAFYFKFSGMLFLMFSLFTLI